MFLNDNKISIITYFNVTFTLKNTTGVSLHLLLITVSSFNQTVVKMFCCKFQGDFEYLSADFLYFQRHRFDILRPNFG